MEPFIDDMLSDRIAQVLHNKTQDFFNYISADSLS
jgi:hypothetical protein